MTPLVKPDDSDKGRSVAPMPLPNDGVLPGDDGSISDSTGQNSSESSGPTSICGLKLIYTNNELGIKLFAVESTEPAAGITGSAANGIKNEIVDFPKKPIPGIIDAIVPVPTEPIPPPANKPAGTNIFSQNMPEILASATVAPRSAIIATDFGTQAEQPKQTVQPKQRKPPKKPNQRNQRNQQKQKKRPEKQERPEKTVQNVMIGIRDDATIADLKQFKAFLLGQDAIIIKDFSSTVGVLVVKLPVGGLTMDDLKSEKVVDSVENDQAISINQQL